MNQPKLKAFKRSFFQVHYRDLEEYIEKVYGVPFEFVEWMQCSNDSSRSFRAEKNPRFRPMTGEDIYKDPWNIFPTLPTRT